MTRSLRFFIVPMLGLFAATAFAGTPAGGVSGPVQSGPPIYDSHAVDLESGMLWQAGENTSIDYRLVPTQFAWRTPRVLGFDFNDGSSISVRHRFALLGTWV